MSCDQDLVPGTSAGYRQSSVGISGKYITKASSVALTFLTKDDVHEHVQAKQNVFC